MKTARNYLLAVVVTLLFLAGAAALFGQSPEPMAPDPPFDDMDPLAEPPGLPDELALSDAQAEQLRTLGREAAKKNIRTRADLDVKRMELEELLEADNPDRALVDKKLREISDLEHALLKSRVDSRLAFAGVLTPEQRAKLRTRLRDRGRRIGRRGWGPHGFRRGDRGFGWRGFRERGFGRPEAPPAPPAPQP